MQIEKINNPKLDDAYQFGTLNVGDGFYVVDPSRFRHVRTIASRYAKAHDVVIHCHALKDGRLAVWRDADRANKQHGPIEHRAEGYKLTAAEQDQRDAAQVVTPVADHPQKAPFLAWLAGLPDNAMIELTDPVSLSLATEIVGWMRESPRACIGGFADGKITGRVFESNPVSVNSEALEVDDLVLTE
jgi:hypothetical protein